MADRRALTRVLDELLWALRRDGFVIATSQAIDAARAALVVGLDDKEILKSALGAVIVQSARDQARFARSFERYFSPETSSRSLWERLSAAGFREDELAELRALLGAMSASSGEAPVLGALLERGPELGRLLQLAAIDRAMTTQNKLQIGFFSYRVLDRIGMPKARAGLSTVIARLTDALGQERAEALGRALRAELDAAAGEVRDHVRQAFERRETERAASFAERTLASTPFTSLRDDEVDEVRRAVRAFAARLRGAARVRARRAKKGRIDPRRTARRALQTSGVPLAPARRKRRRDKPELVLLCDVSDSVRTAAQFMLEFVYTAHELFDKTRSFVFVSELGETTRLFAEEPIHVALGRAYGGEVVSVNDNSNYGRALRAFESRYLETLDRRTTVVILGDGRTNYQDDASEVLDRIRARARGLLWLCPESESEWGTGDSAMARYAPRCDQVLEVRCASDLERAARAILARR